MPNKLIMKKIYFLLLFFTSIIQAQIVNIPDADGVTALTHAKRQKYQPMIRILEAAGAKE